jgi:hypothetical protein
MILKKFSLTAFLLFLILVSGCGEAYQRIVPRAGTDFMPLYEDRQLRYRVTEYGETYEYSMKLRFLGGEKYKVFEASIVDGEAPGGIEYSNHDKQIIAVTQFALTSLESPRQKGEFSQVWIDEALRPGDFWTDNDTGTQTVFTGYEDVTVPAGTFTGCYKTVTEALPVLADSIRARFDRKEMDEEMLEKQLDNAKQIVIRWFAKDVGLVKEQIGASRFVRELLAVENEGWFSPTAQLKKGN